MTLWAALYLACPPSGPSDALAPSPGAALEGCAAYVDSVEIFRTCVEMSAGDLSDPSAAVAACAVLGEQAGACTAAWVFTRLEDVDPPPAEALLPLCDHHDDCTFLVVDQRPAAAVLEQVHRCQEHAGRFAGDCIGHAFQRWAARSPTEAEILAVLPLGAAWPEKVGWAIGVVRYCQGQHLGPQAKPADAVALGCPPAPALLAACSEVIRGTRGSAFGCPKGRGGAPLEDSR